MPETIRILFLFACFSYLHTQPIKTNTQETISIRPAITQDLPAILALDEEITYDFFKPLYLTHYKDYPNGQNPDLFLSKELIEDKKMFPEYVKQHGNDRLYVAYDNNKNIPAGFLVFHRSNKSSMWLELLFIHKDYRRMGLGKKLIETALRVFQGIDTCHVYPLRFGNNVTLKFYEHLGFVNQGIAPKTNSYGANSAEWYFHYMRNK